MVENAENVEVREITVTEEGDALAGAEGDENAITVCYVTHKGEALENGEELNILACGHCLAGFTDEDQLNQHVLTEHADLILQSEEIAVEHVTTTAEEAPPEDHQVVAENVSAHVLDGSEGMKIIQLALAKQQEMEDLEKQKQLEGNQEDEVEPMETS
jgi:hypothetical protein